MHVALAWGVGTGVQECRYDFGCDSEASRTPERSLDRNFDAPSLPYHTHSTYKLSEQPHMHLRVLHMAEHGSREHRTGTSRHTLQSLAAKSETPCDRYTQHAAHHAKVRKT